MKDDKKSSPDAEHLFEYRHVEQKKLMISLSITIIAMVLEFIGGYLTNSMALFSDDTAARYDLSGIRSTVGGDSLGAELEMYLTALGA